MKSAPSSGGSAAVSSLFLVLAAMGGVVALCVGLYRHEAAAIEVRQREREAARVGMYVHYLRSEVRPVMRDLRTLSTGDGLLAYLAAGRGADRERAIVRAAFASRLQPSYERIRFVDENGREVFRVNRGGKVDPEAVGRDVSAQPFFRDAWGLSHGVIYQSAFDLTLEGNRVALPLMPTLRFATPVWDLAGRKRGVYVINYLGDDLLGHLQQLVPAYGHRLRVLNAAGYWIKGDAPGEEWGFVLEGRGGYTLARTEPELWARLQREPAGQAARKDGLLTWQRVESGVLEDATIDRVVADDSFIVIASQVSATEWNALFAGLRLIFYVVTPVLAILAGGGTWLLLARRRVLLALRRSEESLSTTLHSIGDAVLATDTEGRVTLLNPVAETLTGWTQTAARGRPVAEIFRIIHEHTRAPAPIPVEAVLATGEIQALANHTALIARDGTERAIADSAAPLRDRHGQLLGVVLVFRDVTASRRAQAELDRFFSLSLDLLCIASMDGYFKRVSPAITEVLGWTPEEFTARPFMDMIHPEDHPAVVRQLELQAAGHKVMHFECRFQHRDGAWRILSWRSVPDVGSGLLYATARDVTETRKAQAELDRFFTLSVDFLCIAGLDGYFKRASPSVQDILGWSVEEFLTTPFIELIHPDDRAATTAEAEKLAAGQKVLNFENRYRHKDGSWRLLSWRATPHLEAGLLYCSGRDVTDTKRIAAEMERANLELSESRAELRSLFESLPGLYLVLTCDFRIAAVSDAYLAATLTKREAIVGRGLFEVFPDNPDDPAADGVRNLRASLERVLERKVADTMPIQKYDIRRPDGSFEERYWSPINSPLCGAGGQLRYIIHRAEDVTAFVHRQQEKKRGKASEADEAALQRRLEMMEAEIFDSSAKVQAANRQLEMANRELESFSYSVSHDLRAPLRHIQGYVEMLNRDAKDVLSEKARRYLQTIADAGREMGILIDDLLAFSRMGRSEMAEQEVDLNVLVAEVRRGLQPAVGERDVRWTVGPLPRVRGDAAMLRQVLVNLLSNAVKYTRDRNPAEITIGTDGMEEGKAVIFVRDNGAGFDMQYAGKLFGVFQRLHRADEFEGTGIGLANVRRIVARHGGRTWATGEINKGAIFYFTLQLLPLPPDQISTPTP